MAEKLNINWFPGHMTKAKREMQEKLKLVDMVIELRDARIPMASANPLLKELVQNKPRLIILTKIDKAQTEQTKKWIEKLSEENVSVIAFDLLKDSLQKPLLEAVKALMQKKIDRQIRRGIKPRAIRAMVVGIPNVGKSTFINRMAKRKAVEAADRPGVTRSLTWVKVNNELELLDTPGVLWPRFDDPQTAMYLAITGAIRDAILPLEEIAYEALRLLIERSPQLLVERYHIELQEDPYAVLLAIGRSRGFVLRQDQIDEKRTIDTFLKELRSEKIGRITWEQA